MKNLFRIRLATASVLLASLLAFAGVCQADDDCQITLSQPTMDLQVMRKGDAVKSAQGWNQLEERDVSVSVFCPESRNFAVFFSGTAGEKGRFRFGEQSGLSVKISQMTLDGQPYQVAKTLNPGNFNSFESAGEMQLIHSRQGVMAASGNNIIQGQQMNFTMTVTPFIKEGEFPVSDRTTVSSDLALTVVAGQ